LAGKDKGEETNRGRAYTPFGVLEDKAGAYKPFDDESFWEEVLAPSEKEQLKKNKEGFLKDPSSVSTTQKVSASMIFYPWKYPVISSAGRTGLALQMLSSSTWALNKSAIPDFLRLLGKLREKYMDVIGDSKLMGFLEEAEHRAHELQVSDEAGGEKVKSSVRRVASAAVDGVDQQAYDEYVQGLVSKGIPEDQARQLADNLVAQIKQNTANFTAQVQTGVQGLPQSRRGNMRFNRFIKSDGDVIVHQDDDGKDLEEDGGENPDASSGGDDLGLDALGGGEPGAGAGGDDSQVALEDGFMDDVNSLDEFGANEPAMSQDEVFDALQAISQIVDTVLSTEGVKKDAKLTSDEEGFVLDQVDDLAASFGGGDGEASVDEALTDKEGGDSIDAAEDEELESFENIGAGLVRVLVAGQPVKRPAFSSVFLTKEKYGGLDAVICSGVNSGHSLVLDGEGDDNIQDTVVCSSLAEIKSDTPVQVGYLKASAFKNWVKQSRQHRLAWRVAVNQTARRLGYHPKTLPEMASALAIASEAHDKWFKNGKGKIIQQALLGRSIPHVRRVVSAMQKRVAEGKSMKVIRSDYNGYKNFQTWNVAEYLKQDEVFRAKASSFLKSNRGAGYDQLIRGIGLAGSKTPDNIDWLDSRIDRGEMGDVLSFISNSFKGRGMGNIKSRVSVRDKKGAMSSLRRICSVANESGVEDMSADDLAEWLYGLDMDIYTDPERDKDDLANTFYANPNPYDVVSAVEDYSEGERTVSVSLAREALRILHDRVGFDAPSQMGGMYSGAKLQRVGSATQVDGGKDEVVTVQGKSPTGLSTAGKTFTSGEIEGENSTRAVNVNGGDTSEIEDVDNTGNDGSLEADIDAGTEFNGSGYSFDSSKIAALELPIEGEDKTQVLGLKHVGSGVYMLGQAYESPGAGRCSFTKGQEAKIILSRNVKPSSLRANVDRVITLKGSKDALLLRSSSVLGVIGVEAPFSKGLKNARYSVFSRTGVNLVNEDGFYFSFPKGPQKIIASAVSNKSVRRGTEKFNVFSDIEQSYINYLRSCLARSFKENAVLKNRLGQAVKSQQQRARLHSRAIEQERQRSRTQIASSLADLQSVRVKSAEAEAQRVFSGSQHAIAEEQKAIQSQAQRNIDYLAKMMGSI
jgi:hypothetical protein